VLRARGFALEHESLAAIGIDYAALVLAQSRRASARKIGWPAHAIHDALLTANLGTSSG
jgi:hypothetical protein